MTKIRITRRELLQGITASAGYFVLKPAATACAAGNLDSGIRDTSNKLGVAYRVTLPQQILPLPDGVQKYKTPPGFKLRGIKGWAWVPSQYLAEIPVVARYKMNFLMNCYTSLWDLEVHDHGRWAQIPRNKNINFWYRPLPEEKRRGYERVVKECKRHGLEFCFSMNPILYSDRPFDYDKPQDFEAFWRHYAWMQSLGVKWFNVSLDDIRQGINARAQTKVANEILRRLLKGDSDAQLIFTPTWYAGTGDSGPETHAKLGTGDTPGIRYTKELAERLDKDVYLYWTGPEVCSLTITRADAEKYKLLAKHRLIIWDNYPCNDHHPNLQLGPLMGRGQELPAVAEGYISNPLSPQNEANRIPMLTIADYAWNPKAYNPARSIGQSVAHLGRTTAQRLALKDLVELYPGRLVARSQSTAWNSLLECFSRTLDGGSQKAARDLIDRAKSVSQQMKRELPGEFVLAQEMLDTDISKIQMEYSRKYSST